MDQAPPGGGAGDHALMFAGGATRQEVELDAVCTPGNQYAVEAWVKPTDASQYYTIVGQHGGAGDAKGTIDMHLGKARFLVTTSGLTQLYSDSIIPSGVWTHIAGVYDGGHMRIYINGQQDTSTVKTGNITSANVRSTRIGGYAGSSAGGTGWFNGKIDEVRIWDVARSQEEIAGNMHSEIEAQAGSGLIGYWRLNEGTGVVTADRSGNNNTGILTNYQGSMYPVWVTDTFPPSKVVASGELAVLPQDTRLQANYPNPFNPTTSITYEIDRQERVRLDVFDVVGQKVRTLVYADKPQGRYQVIWDGRTDLGEEVSSGVYVYRLVTPTHTACRKMSLVR